MKKPLPVPLHPQEQTGWNFMVAGLCVLITAGILLYLTPDTEPVYHQVGNYLTGIGLAVYITGRIIRRKGRKLREKGGIQ